MTARKPDDSDPPILTRTDRALRRLARVILSVFFREIEVVGTEHVPATGPLLLVANHPNSLVDGGMLMGFMPRMPRLLAASTVWDFQVLRPFLRAARVIPVYRRHEVGGAAGRNVSSFDDAYALFAQGGVLAMFPEGISHNAPQILPMKSGASRIAVGAEHRHGPLGLTIMPIALVYESKSKFRSRALIQIGEPIAVGAELDSFAIAETPERARAVRALSARLRDGLASVGHSHQTWDEAHLVARAAEIWGQPQTERPARMSLAGISARRRAFAVGLDGLNARDPARFAVLRDRLSTYDTLVSAAGLRDDQVAAAYPARRIGADLARTGLGLALRLPFVPVGAALNLVPLLLARRIGTPRDLDKKVTFTLFAALILFPALWLLQSILAGMLTSNVWIGAATFVAAPVSGLVTLGFFDGLRRIRHDARALRHADERTEAARQLAVARARVLAHLAEVPDADALPAPRPNAAR